MFECAGWRTRAGDAGVRGCNPSSVLCENASCTDESGCARENAKAKPIRHCRDRLSRCQGKGTPSKSQSTAAANRSIPVRPDRRSSPRPTTSAPLPKWGYSPVFAPSSAGHGFATGRFPGRALCPFGRIQRLRVRVAMRCACPNHRLGFCRGGRDQRRAAHTQQPENDARRGVPGGFSYINAASKQGFTSPHMP